MAEATAESFPPDQETTSGRSEYAWRTSRQEGDGLLLQNSQPNGIGLAQQVDLLKPTSCGVLPAGGLLGEPEQSLSRCHIHSVPELHCSCRLPGGTPYGPRT